ncbi:MAG: DUF3800 domain-containing protein [Bifidobacteriaceae bacterium]|jgi:hypothetical protein|nr:DUF3800 domain-containing protein [Bifidobacteriaceae bacterium]
MSSSRLDSKTESPTQYRSRQLVFIDDSGDPGFKLGGGSSDFFVIAAVIFDSVDDANKLREKIRECKKHLRLVENYELKFYSTKKRYVTYILKNTTSIPFRVETMVIDKSNFRIGEYDVGHMSLYYFTIRELLLKSKLFDAFVVLDGKNESTYRRDVKSYIRNQLNTNSRRVRQIRFVDSKSEALIQFADLVVGSVRRSYDVLKSDQNDYLRIIPRETSVKINML